MTSKNYNQKGKTTGGKNGFGAKLVNLFSSWFSVETVDHIRGLKYTQIFETNMTVKHKPLVKQSKVKPYTKISWKIDFPRFQITSYSQDMISLLHRRVYDIAGITHKKVNVYYNKEKIKVKSFESYVKLYLTKEPLVYEQCNDRWEICVCSSTTDKYEHYSFVNGIFTSKGGKHVDMVTKKITSGIQDYIQKKHKKKVPESYIKHHLKLFVNSVIEDPSFDSQSKERLITSPSKFGSTVTLSSSFSKKLCETIDIVDRVLSFADYKENKQSKKTDGAKKQKIQIPKLDDANWAGTKRSEETVLILTEGDSAKTMAISGLSVVGRDKYGVFPLRGKVLNVKEASLKQITDNTEITHLKKILGLESNKHYTDTKSLRYGSILIMTDQDHDGSHIKGLVMLIFETLWPSLLQFNYINAMIYPIVKVSKGKQSQSFYNLTEFQKWKDSTPQSHKWKCKYYKGLGTSTSLEAREYFRDMKITRYQFTETTTAKMNLAFKKDCSNDRKQWLYQYNPKNIIENNHCDLGIDEFIEKELIHFSNSDTKRSIGSLYDGLKPSQRKILYCCFKRKLFQEIRVAQLAGYVSEHAAYHHGEASLQSTIIGMAQQFVGTNNIHLLKPNGQFGSRIQGGSDSASPRYIHTELNKVVELIFPKQDFDLLRYEDDDGIPVEPVYYVPILPMVLVNGMKGIGTGFSTDIPQFNPLDVIDNLIRKLNQESYVDMIPWYRGFQGTIQKISAHKYLTKGKYDVIGKRKIKITELPIGKWTQDYKDFLTSSLVEKRNAKPTKTKFLLDFEDHSTDNEISFLLTMTSDISQYVTYDEKDKMDTLEKMLKLYTYKTTSNMHLYEHNLKIKKYTTISHILDDFYNERYQLYVTRKQHQIQEYERQITILRAKCTFIRYVIEDTIHIYKQSQESIIKQLKHHKFPYVKQSQIVTHYDSDCYHYLITIPIRDFSQDKQIELETKVEQLQNEYETYKKQTIQSLWLSELTQLKRSIQ